MNKNSKRRALAYAIIILKVSLRDILMTRKINILGYYDKSFISDKKKRDGEFFCRRFARSNHVLIVDQLSGIIPRVSSNELNASRSMRG